MKKEVKNFYDLEAWRVGHALTLEVYQLTTSFPKEELFGMVSQLRRATSSITANLAEGFARYHFADKVRFYYQARGSAAEVQNFLLLAKDLNLIERSECEKLGKQAVETSQLINGMIRSIEKQQ